VHSAYQLKGPDYRDAFEALAWQDMKIISTAMLFYYNDNEEWPVDLDTLFERYKLGAHKFKLPGKYNIWELDWIYYPAKFPTGKIDSNQIMLATPTHWDKDKKAPDKGCESFRIVAYYDGTVKKISEKEYQKQVKARNISEKK